MRNPRRMQSTFYKRGSNVSRKEKRCEPANRGRASGTGALLGFRRSEQYAGVPRHSANNKGPRFSRGCGTELPSEFVGEILANETDPDGGGNHARFWARSGRPGRGRIAEAVASQRIFTRFGKCGFYRDE